MVIVFNIFMAYCLLELNHYCFDLLRLRQQKAAHAQYIDTDPLTCLSSSVKDSIFPHSDLHLVLLLLPAYIIRLSQRRLERATPAHCRKYTISLVAFAIPDRENAEFQLLCRYLTKDQIVYNSNCVKHLKQ